MVKQGPEEIVILPIPNEERLKSIKHAIGEDKKLEVAEKLLYQWLVNQPYFPNDFDRNIIRNFLRGSKFDVERTKKTLQINYATRPLHPEIFEDRYPASKYLSKAKNILEIGSLPNLTPDGHRVHVFKFKENDEKHIPAAIKFFFAFYDLLMKNPYPTNGEIAILDVRDLSTGFLLRAFPYVKTVVTLLRKIYSVRLKKVHLLVSPQSGIERILTLVRPLLHQKIKENMLIHDNCDGLYEYFHKDSLPTTFGGSYKSVDDLDKDWHEYITESAEWLDEHHKRIALELPSKDETSYFKDELGIDGCFRKLEID